MALQGLGDLEGAVTSLRRAVALDPSVPDALNSLGLALMQSGNGAEAVETFRRMRRIRPSLPAG